MQTSKEIKNAFIDELFELFRKHRAEVSVEMEPIGHIYLNVCMVERSGPNGERLNQFTEFRLDNADLAHWRCPL